MGLLSCAVATEDGQTVGLQLLPSAREVTVLLNLGSDSIRLPTRAIVGRPGSMAQAQAVAGGPGTSNTPFARSRHQTSLQAKLAWPRKHNRILIILCH